MNLTCFVEIVSFPTLISESIPGKNLIEDLPKEFESLYSGNKKVDSFCVETGNVYHNPLIESIEKYDEISPFVSYE